MFDIAVNKSKVVIIDTIRVMKRKHEENIVEIAQKTIRIAKTKLKRKKKKCNSDIFTDILNLSQKSDIKWWIKINVCCKSMLNA